MAGWTCILIETIFDTLNAKAAMFATEEVFARREAQGLQPARVPIHDFRDDHGQIRANANGADGGGVLQCDPACAAAERGL